MKSIIQVDDDKCFECRNAFGTEWHHIFGGQPNRAHSEDDGLKVRMCRSCHEEIHHGKNCKAMMERYHELGQVKWEAYYGPALIREGKDPREEFRKRYGKNWLEDEEQ